jgi:energy-coupling factor transporter ATP-binding protein EcfA2
MIIRKLILKGYKRLFLNNIDYLEYTPESNIQILLGSNGSGKSSVLNMLNPLPADIKKEFREDGYKYIEITHRNREYIISSNYKDKNKHSFIVDGLELNTGGTKKVQLDLAYEHFKINPSINNILLGLDSLTTMFVFIFIIRADNIFSVTMCDLYILISIFSKFFFNISRQRIEHIEHRRFTTAVAA